MTPIVPPTRRDVLAAAALGLGLSLVGCAGSRRSRSHDREPLWPDDQPRIDEPRTAREPVAPAPYTADTSVIDRSQWTTEGPIMSLANPMGDINRITVHHDGMPPVTLTTSRDVAARIELIRRSHLGRGWADIGYHYVIDPQGRIWRARPRSLQGAHVKYNNENNLGIMVLGNFMEQRPTPQALASLDAFIVGNMRRFRIPVNNVYTHQELRATACPGTHLQSHMQRSRSYGGTIARA